MKLPKPALALAFAVSLTLVGCGGNEYGQENGEYNGNNTQPIGYNQTSNEPMQDRANNTGPGQGSNNPNMQGNENNQFMFDGKTNRDADNMTNSRREGSNYEVADNLDSRVLITR